MHLDRLHLPLPEQSFVQIEVGKKYILELYRMSLSIGANGGYLVIFRQSSLFFIAGSVSKTSFGKFLVSLKSKNHLIVPISSALNYFQLEESSPEYYKFNLSIASLQTNS